MDFPLPTNEAERLQALHQFAILDTSPEAAFDRITNLAARLFNVPIALVSLVDEERQWFKACYGLDTRQTGRDISFCAHAILRHDLMVVPDATLDPRFATNPLVTGPPHIRFYAGAPLRTPEGLNMGTLCIMDTAPRELSAAEQATLTDLAVMVVDGMELRRVAARLREEAAERQRAEAASSQLAAIVESSDAAITSITPDGIVASWNAAAERVYGYSTAEMKGSSIARLMPPDHLDEWIYLFARILQGEPMEHYETKRMCKDGRVIDVSLTISPIRDAEGRITGISAISRDITERKRIEQALQSEQEFLKVLLENLQEGIVACDADGRLTLFNRATREFHDLSEEPLPAEQWAQHYNLYRPDGKTLMAVEEIPLVRALRGEVVRDVEMVIAPWSGHPARTMLASGQAIFDAHGHKLGAVVVMRDITERKRAEETLQRAHDELEERVRERTAHLSAANERAQVELARREILEWLRETGYAVTRILAEAHTLEDAAPDVLRVIGENTGWDYAGFWVVEPPAGAADKAMLRAMSTWCRSESCAEFGALSRQLTFVPGVGLPGRVWAAGHPLWLADAASDTTLPRAAVAAQVGLHGSFGFPILWGGEVLGVLEFFRHVMIEPDREMFDLLAGLGSQIGQFLERKRIEQAVQQSEARKAAILDAALDAIITMDHEGNVVEFNPAAETIFGYSRDEVLGREMAEMVIPEPLRERHRSGLAHYLVTGEAPLFGQRLELSALRKDGTEFPVELTVTPIAGEGPPLFTGFVRDITTRRRAEEALRQSEERLRAIIQSLDEIVFEFDGEGTYVNLWTANEGLLALPKIELLGRRVADVLGEAAAIPFVTLFRRVLASGQAESLEYPIGVAEGQHWFLARISPIRAADGSYATVCMLSRNITELKQAEAALRHAKEEAETANRAKSEFLSRMSHELRTPLNAILGFGQLLEMDDLEPRQSENLEHILKAGQHLLSLVNEVLDISRMETGRLTLEPEPVEVRAVLREALDEVRPLAMRYSVRLEPAPQCDGSILVDRHRLRQVLGHLLSNAVKFNREGGGVTVGCEAVSGERLRMAVRDTGPGIASERREKLFTPFERLDAEQRGIDGTGIGLALAKWLTEAMGGSIGMESEVGQGSTFWIELPLAEVSSVTSNGPGDASQVTLDPQPVTPTATVLYIEDNASNLALVESILAHQPAIELISAMQSLEGLELARRHRPALILLDMQLPDLPGDEVLRRLQADATTRDIPVIVLSADAMPHQIQKALAAGARDYLTKPLDVRRFLQVLKDSLKSA